MQILSALESTAISRLRRTWKGIDKRSQTALAELRDSLKFERNYKTYRAILGSVTGAVVPYLGIYLSNLTGADEGNETYIGEDNGVKLINFDKCLVISSIISDVVKYPSY
jgi:hypothetical protein